MTRSCSGRDLDALDGLDPATAIARDCALTMSDPHEPASETAPVEHSEHVAHGPRIPEVVDEAGPSPTWLPWLGLGLLCLALLAVAGRDVLAKRAGDDAAEPTAAEQAGIEGEKPAGDAPAADKPAGDKPAAADGHEGHGH